MTDADVLIVGAGIAGMSAAYFAARAGRAVTVVDDGRHRASDLPIALVNPLRGHDGRLVADGIEGMRATFALVDTLRGDGHAIDTGRGLYRPLVDLDGDLATEGYWRARLAARLAFDWVPHASPALGLAVDVPALRLYEPGWVAAPSLLRALRDASAATLVPARVATLASDDRGARATLDDGRRLVARTVLWCGGAWGAAGLDGAFATRLPRESAAHDALYKPGSLLASASALTTVALSFGLYAIPLNTSEATGATHVPDRPLPCSGTLIGPTREPAQASFPDACVAPASIAHLQDRVARHFGDTMPLCPVWRGVRLARLSSRAADALRGVSVLTAFGSRGFLTAPLQAARWAQSL